MKEKKFYDSAIQDYIIGNQDGLNISKQSKLTICSNSNLGYELLYTNHKVVFFVIKMNHSNFSIKNKDLFGTMEEKSKKLKN